MIKGMKRLEVIVPSNKMSLVVSAIEDVSVAGITVVESRGRGKGARPSVRSSRGTKMQQAEYNSLITIITIVDDSDVERIIPAILDVASTGTSGDGKIFISDVSEIIDIQTRRREKDVF
jgi:nitrogen regulatory protein P-II 1